MTEKKSITIDRDIQISTVGRDDYPELEGKIIEYDAGQGPGQRFFNGLVVGCNRSVGITIVNAENKDMYLICIVGPVSPNHSDLDCYNTTYEEYFDYVVRSIEDGLYEATAPQNPIASMLGGGPSGDSCMYAM